MSHLPSPEDLSLLVSYVFEVMLTLRCELVGKRNGVENEPLRDRLQDLAWRTAVLPIAGARPLTVVLSSDQQGHAGEVVLTVAKATEIVHAACDGRDDIRPQYFAVDPASVQRRSRIDAN